ncbi:hypothetical protein ElyMa_005421100 [Elysia marginata]|uniref:Uncharacterized protein n=1 Tax=Elysia marginata TaxID=1093978 RepID=A0AAV4EJ38_9GAST|nr:hypothetical protein ElyMa_005421100 [Elysia marginata]
MYISVCLLRLRDADSIKTYQQRIQGDTRTQYQARGALSNAPPAPTRAAPPAGQYTSSSGSSLGQQANFRDTANGVSLGQFSVAGDTGTGGQLTGTGTDQEQMLSSGGTSFGQFSTGGNGGTGGQFVSGQFITREGNIGQGQLSVTGNGLGLVSQDQNLVTEKSSGASTFSAGGDGIGQFSLGGGEQISKGGESLGQFNSEVGSGLMSQGNGQFSQIVEGSNQFSQGLGNAGQFSQTVEGTGQFSQNLGGTGQFSQGSGGTGQFSQGLGGAGQYSQEEVKAGQFVSGSEISNQFLLDSGQMGSSSQSLSTGLGSPSASQNHLVSHQISGAGQSVVGGNGGQTSMLN